MRTAQENTCIFLGCPHLWCPLFFPCLLPTPGPLLNTASASASCPWLTNHFLASPCKSRNVWLPAIIIHIANSGSAGCPTCHCFSAIRKSLTCFTSRVRSTASSRCRKFTYLAIAHGPTFFSF